MDELLKSSENLNPVIEEVQQEQPVEEQQIRQQPTTFLSKLRSIFSKGRD